MTADEFDPASVPRFPVFTLVTNEGEGLVELDGLAIEPALGEQPRDAGIAAVVQKIKAHRLHAVRVRARSGVDDEFWDLVVTDQGNTYDVTPNVSDQTSSFKRRKYFAIIAGAAALTLTAAGTAFVALNATKPAQPVAWTTPGANAQIPVALPPGFATTATWSLPVKKGSSTSVLDTGHVISTDQAGNIVARDPQTGQPKWTGNNAPNNMAAVEQTTWAGIPAITAESERDLKIWDLHTPAGGGISTAHSIPVTNDQHVETDGPTPFINRGDWVVSVPADNFSVRDIVIPAGTLPVMAGLNGEVTVIGRNAIHTVATDGSVAKTLSFAPPKGTSGQPALSWVLDENHVVIGWAGTKPVLAIVDITTGKITASASARNLPRENTLILSDPHSKTAVLDNFAITYGKTPAIKTLESFTATSIHNGIAYGETSEGPASINLQTLNAPTRWITYTADDPAPDLVTDDAAYIVAPMLDQTVLYRAERSK